MATLFRPRPRTALTNYHRAFSTTPSHPISLQLDRNDPEAVADTVPPYPYGPTRWYKQSRLGLYGGQKIQFGNNIGPEFGVKTRRNWHPNIMNKKLFSKSLNRLVQVRVSTRVLRTIDKLGGLDEYLLGEKEGRIRELGESGWWLRWAIMQTDVIKARFKREREALGVPEVEAEVGEAQAAVIEEASEAEVAAAEATGEAVANDGAFQIESSPTLPALKFRVAPGKHLVLTPTGWMRTRPTMPHQHKLAIQALIKEKEDELISFRQPVFEESLQTLESEKGKDGKRVKLSEEEKKGLLKEARRGWRAEAKEMAMREWEAKLRRKAERVKRRREERVQRAREEGQGEASVAVA